MRAVLAVLVIVALGGMARANPEHAAARPMSESARPYFDRGAAAYQAGAYAEAIEAFEHGQRIDSHPDFLYALAQAYRKHGDCARAISLYQAFLATRPPDEEAERARANLERCPLSPLPPAAPVAAPPASAEAPGYVDTTGVVLAGTGLVSAAVGATYLVLADQNISRANNATTLGALEKLGAAGSRDRWIGGLCLAGGGALVVGAAVRYALRRRERPASRRTISIAPAPAAVAITWGGAF
jgi:tetratricopeptide (TPR) repeat protein